MLVDSLKVLLATTYSFVIKAQNFHWNVEGPDFPQYHEFFGKLYESSFESIDAIAEKIRTLDSYTPGSLSRFTELSLIEDQVKIPRAELMIMELHADNQKLIQIQTDCFHFADEEDKQGIADFLAGLIDQHEKHAWMLRSLIKKQRV